MFKAGFAAATLMAVAFSVPAGTTSAEALPLVKPAVQDANVKHEVGRWRRGFRGFRGRGFRGFRRHRFRGFRGRRFGGLRLGYRRGFRRRHRLRYYYGAPYVSYGYYRRGGCRHLKRRAKYTGNPYYWEMYKRCKFGYRYY
ncbi:MAG: hypothetical protein K0U34_05240 [Alphaproteobacteria bacterium]|nr:hypothetical protein [Alphaproteobacteria bacterium]